MAISVPSASHWDVSAESSHHCFLAHSFIHRTFPPSQLMPGAICVLSGPERVAEANLPLAFPAADMHE